MKSIPRHHAFCIGILIAITTNFSVAQSPDLSTNRYATDTDAAFWHNVNAGDYLFFTGNTDGGQSIYSGPASNGIILPVGGRILIYANSYERIMIDGSDCASTEEVPTVITNFGGQVRWGESLRSGSHRNLELRNFEHLHLTGKYDPVHQTGHVNFLGHDAGRALGSGDYYEKYGLWGDTRWSGMRSGQEEGNLVRAFGYKSIKIDYVASWGGPFACFNLKTDYPSHPGLVKVDIQDTFCGLSESEGFYISFSTAAEGQDITQLTLRNNIIVLTGSEGLQTDNLAPGSIIENNVVVGTGRFYRRPFSAKYQVNAHQFSFVAGDVTVRDNIVIGTTGFLIAPRYRFPGAGRVTPSTSKPVLIENNYYGYGENDIGYVFQGDGITPLHYINNVFGPISIPTTDDSKSDPDPINSLITFGNDNTPITLKENIYPPGAPFYRFNRGSGANLVEDTANEQTQAQPVAFVDIGFGDDFDLRNLAFYTTTYSKTPDGKKDGTPVPYATGDVVMTYDETGQTLFFRCLKDHNGDPRRKPLTTPDYWEPILWNGRTLPPFDVRLKSDTHYNYRGMGLPYNEANLYPPDLERPVLTLDRPNVSFTRGSEYFEFGVTAMDDVQGDLSSEIKSSWVGAHFDSEKPGTYYRRYEVSDRAGNPAIPIERQVTVSDSSVNILREMKVNFHRYSPAELNDWTDLGNGTPGLVQDGPTYTTLYEKNGTATNVNLLIDDIEGGYSEHWKDHRNTAGIEIGDFPAEVTRTGLRLRDPHENPCVLVFTGLLPTAAYDVHFTGYVDSGSGSLDSTLSHVLSGQSKSLNIRFNTEYASLLDLATTPTGRLDLEFSTTTASGLPNISGVILQEKTGAGVPGEHPTFTGLTTENTIQSGDATTLFELELFDGHAPSETLTLEWRAIAPMTLPEGSVTISGTGSTRTVNFDSEHLSIGTKAVTFLLSDESSYYAKTAVIRVTESYVSWARRHFSDQIDDPSLEAHLWGADADPDQDAFTNQFERLFHLDPEAVQSSPFSIDESDSAFNLTFGINAGIADNEWRLELSSDLINWTNVSDTLTASAMDSSIDHYIYVSDDPSSSPSFFRFSLNH